MRVVSVGFELARVIAVQITVYQSDKRKLDMWPADWLLNFTDGQGLTVAQHLCRTTAVDAKSAG